MNQEKNRKKVLCTDYIPMLLAAILIIFFAAWRGQSFIKTLPTLITLFVQILMVRANRVAFLVGGANAVLYGVSYYSEGLYFSAFSSALISAPIMLFSYFNWKKNGNQSNPKILMLDNKKRALVVLVTVVSWIICVKLGGNIISTGRFVWFDSLCFVMGLAITLLTAFGYVDAQYLNLFSCTVTLVMWMAVCMKEPQNINFVVISAYNLFRVVQAAINWTKIHKNGGEYEKIAD